MKVAEQHLAALAETITCPTYDRSELSHGIVHIGIGGFHRSHQAYYLHQLLGKEGSAPWGICGIGLREGDRKMAETMASQDGLYTLVAQHASGTVESEIIGAITEYILAVDSPQAAIDKMAHPHTQIVSLTITEGGYNFHPATGEFMVEHPDVQAELTHPDQPRTVYGYLTAALRKRRANGLPAFTILSCDNIQHNGDVTRAMLLAFAKHQDPELAAWIKAEVCFPNSMVDRITPVTDPSMIEMLKTEYGLEDQWPVVCEPFIQWVVEDRFSQGRPELEKVGVQFVPDVTPYEKMKIRLLNAGHSVLGIPGAIHGHPTIEACMRDEVFSTFMRQFMDQEASPVVGEVAGMDLDRYKDQLAERFANPNIKDSVSRICSESAAKLPKFLIPTLQENLASGGSIRYATFILAAWCYYSDKGIDENLGSIERIDVKQDELHQAASQTQSDWTSFLNQPEIFGDLNQHKRFVEAYTRMVQAIYREQNIRKLMQEI
ncbi:MAG: mannitol dehydrogenase family protein [Bacteroidota bacterium]